MKEWQKHLILFILGACLGIILTEYCEAAERCVKDSSGGICCWNTETDGTIKPIYCA
jgi:hypothetical protein